MRSLFAGSPSADEYGPESILPYSYAGTIGQLGGMARWIRRSSTGSADLNSTAPSALRLEEQH